MKTPINTIWALPDLTTGFDGGAGRSADDHANWARLVREIAELGTVNGWSKTEMAERLDVRDGTFSQWFSGKYAGRFDTNNQLVERGLETFAEANTVTGEMPLVPGYFQTSFSKEVWSTLAAAQMMPSMVTIAADAGFGKTITAKAYQARNTRVHLATMNPNIRSVHAMLQELANALDVTETNATRVNRAIGRKLQRMGNGTLLIVDEAQELPDDAVNQLRHFMDIYECGIALMGNMETHRRFSTSWLQGKNSGQLASRVYKRVKRDRPAIEDLHAFIGAWGITDQSQIEFLTGIGMKAGALRQIKQTVILGKMVALGYGRAMTLADLRGAWKNRNVEA